VREKDEKQEKNDPFYINEPQEDEQLSSEQKQRRTEDTGTCSKCREIMNLEKMNSK
jgi:hypothetical protein